MCTLKSQALVLRMQQMEKDSRDSSAPQRKVICVPLLSTHQLDRDLHVSMVVRPEMTPIESSKVLRCVLDKAVFDYLIGLQRRLPALPFDDQLVRPDLPDDMKLAIMDVIRGPEVNNVLRGTLLKTCNINGFHHFIVKQVSPEPLDPLSYCAYLTTAGSWAANGSSPQMTCISNVLLERNMIVSATTLSRW